MNYALLLCSLLSTSITVAMEIVQHSSEKEIYSLFVNNQYSEAKKKFNSNDDEKTTASLLQYGIEQNNAKFIQWLLTTKPLPSDAFVLKKSLEYSRHYTNEAAHALREHVQLQQDLDKYIKQETAKLAQAEKALSTTPHSTPQEGWSAQQSAPAQKDTWEEKMKNAKPIPEARYVIKKDGTIIDLGNSEDCRCTIS